MRIVDSHQHVFWHGRDDVGLVADMDAQGIDIAWLLSWEVPPDEDAPAYRNVLNPVHARPDGTHGGIPLVDLLAARSHHPDRFVVGYCPNPRDPGAPSLLEAAHHIHGVRVCGEWKFRLPLDDPRCILLFRKAGVLGCPVVVHLDVPWLPRPETGETAYFPEWYGGTVDNLERAAAACPGTIFVGHGPGFWREMSGDADASPDLYPRGPIVEGGRLHGLLERCPNLWADLSAGSALNALKRDAGNARAFVCRWSDRLLFARDYYGGDLAAFLDGLDLPDSVREHVYGGNACRLVPV